MKALIVAVVLIGGILLGLQLLSRSIDDTFDPTEQGKQARAAVQIGADWMDVLETVGEPSYWDNNAGGLSNERFDEKTRGIIAGQMERNQLPYGFRFLYRYSDAVTFTVCFNKKGKASTVQDKESKADLLQYGD